MRCNRAEFDNWVHACLPLVCEHKPRRMASGESNEARASWRPHVTLVLLSFSQGNVYKVEWYLNPISAGVTAQPAPTRTIIGMAHVRAGSNSKSCQWQRPKGSPPHCAEKNAPSYALLGRLRYNAAHCIGDERPLRKLRRLSLIVV